MYRAVVEAQNMLIRPRHAIKNFSLPFYTSDSNLYKKDTLPLPEEVQEIIREGGRMGLVDGLSLLWAFSKRRLVLWDLFSPVVHEVETRTAEILSVYPITPRADVFSGNVQACLLLFTAQEVSFLCKCMSSGAYASPGVSVSLPVQMSSVCADKEGRIFLGGTDGNIYELVYGQPGWFGNKSTHIVCHTSGILSFFFPFLSAANRKAAILQMVSTRRGLLVLYSDNVLEAFDVQRVPRKVRTADLSALGVQKTDCLQLISVDGGGYEAYLILSNGVRVFLDNYGSVVGKRELPVSRLQYLSRTATLPKTREIFFSIGKYLVILANRERNSAVSVVCPNKEEQNGPENCCTVFLNGSGYILAAYAPADIMKRGIQMQDAEGMLIGIDIALLSRDSVDIYRIADGVDTIERSSFAPECLFSYCQRQGSENALFISLYAAALGLTAPAIQSIFRKSPFLHRKYISVVSGIILCSIWDVDLSTVVSACESGEACTYSDKLEVAATRIRRLRAFLQKESLQRDEIIIDNGNFTVVDMLDDVLEAIGYIGILLESDLAQVLSNAAKKASQQLKVSLSTAMHPTSAERISTLSSLIDMHIGNSDSVDAISAILNDKCPSLFAHSDTLLLKGKDALAHAENAANPEDREWYLEKSLGYFLKTSRMHMQFILEAYIAANYAKGVLCILKAGFSSITAKEVTECIRKMEYRKELLQETLIDERPAFVYAVLDAIIEKIEKEELQPEDLLKIKSMQLEEYLDKMADERKNESIRSLAWKYHAKHGNYYASMMYLMKAADDKENFVPLKDKVEYLTIACTMQKAAGAQKYLPLGRIKEYAAVNTYSTKEKLCIAQKQLEVMASVISAFTSKSALQEDKAQISEVFSKLEQGILEYQELFEICVAFGFSLIALSISKEGMIDDPSLNRALWKDALSGTYTQAISVLKNNREVSSSAQLDLLMEILLQKKLESQSVEEENIGSVFLSLGFPPIAIARILEAKSCSSEYSSPEKKKVILTEAVEFCRLCSLPDLYHRLSSIQRTLGLA